MSEPTTVSSTRPSRTARTARVADAGIFALHALLFASWTPHIPVVKDDAGLNEGTLGIALLGAPVGAIVAAIVVGPILARWGSRTIVRLTLLGYAVVAPALGLVDSLGALFGVLAVWGLFQGALDIAMNAQAVGIEERYGRPILSSFHATWAAAATAGAGLGSLALRFDIALGTQMLLLGGVALVALVVLTRLLYAADHPHHDATQDASSARPGVDTVGTDRATDSDADAEDGNGPATTAGARFGWITPRLLVIAGIMLAALLCEGAASEWAPLYLRDDLAVDASTAGLGYTVFAAAMFVGRAFGDRWVARFGGTRVVATLVLTGCVGVSAALLIEHLGVALAGFALYGLGIACIVPVSLSAAAAEAAEAGAHAGRAIALADGVGRAGFLFGPPLIGSLAHATSLPLALGILPLGCLAIALGSRVLDARRTS